MTPEKRHQAWLQFSRDVLGVAIGLSVEDLQTFLEIARKQHPALTPIIKDYIALTRHSETSVQVKKPSRAKTSKRTAGRDAHLFDLLREKTFFPQNLDLARFAGRVLPNMRSYRFDKMSRSDIAARIVDYIESLDDSSRKNLEDSMRNALAELSGKTTQEVDRHSFLSKWERIIRGDE